ncbi:MAG: TolC family protein, partial [Alistipes sp.]|nr:TolC family protein [Alistipes sp.]
MKKIVAIFALLLVAVPTEAQMRLTLRSCLERGLEQNFEVQLVRNEEQIAANNATPAGAGMLPSVGLSANVGATLTSTTTKQTDGAKETERNAFDQSAGAGVTLNWTIFEGAR